MVGFCNIIPHLSFDYFLTVGLCGGFTTFSTFTNDLFLLGRNQQWEIALLYGIVSFIGGILCLVLGYKLTTL